VTHDGISLLEDGRRENVGMTMYAVHLSKAPDF